MVENDQFYTKTDVAKKYWDILVHRIDLSQVNIFLEPSAGKGGFFTHLPEDRKIGLDIDPKCNGIVRMDFFEYVPERNKKYVVVGNPPFGKVSSLAVRFFNKAAQFAEVIAFIVPRTFKRVSIMNQLNKNFHLDFCEDLPMQPCCFEPKMSAKCCFQIWCRRETERAFTTFNKTHKDFEFLKHGPKDDDGQPTPPTNAHFAVRAYGGMCGEIKTENLLNLRPKSWHWIRSRIDVNELVNRISDH
jgi:hypothetical protein